MKGATAVCGGTLAALLAGCGASTPPRAVTVTETATAVVTTTAPLPSQTAVTATPPTATATATATAPATPEASIPPAPRVDFVMPRLTGVDLQTAQDTIQTHGIFYSTSHDLRGSRMQVVDSNWTVCDQTPAAGRAVTGLAADWEGRIDLGVVKRGEGCP